MCVLKLKQDLTVQRRVCELETGPHSTAALMQARPGGGALT